MDEFGIAQAQPVVNPTAGKIANLLRQAKDFGNQYEIKDYVPFFGGTGLGDLFLGQAPEEVNRWSYGDYPFRNPSSVVGTGGNRLDVWKTGRFEPTFDVVANVALPAVGTAQMAGKPLAKALAPKAGEMAENYLRTVGGIADVAPVGPKPQELAQALRMPEKNELGFYSPLDEAVMNLQNPKGTGQQYLAQLLKTQGVKQEEVSTRGLDTFLANNPKVTREEIAQYLRENPVTLKEKVLDENYEKVGSFDDYQLRGGDIIDDTAYMDDIANDEYFRIKSDESDLISELRIQAYNDLDINPATNDLSELNKIDDYVDNAVREQAEQYARDVYYENPYRSYYDDLGYEVTGNDDIGYYIKDPQGREVSTGRSGIYDISDVESRIREDALDRGLLSLNEEGPKYADYVLPNGENYREVLIQYPNERPAFSEKDIGRLNDLSNKTRTPAEDIEYKQLANRYDESLRGERTPEFRSGHFDEPNILAHMRVTDREIDGKKTLFVEEIQSDWHQTGRKKGYFDQKAIDRNIEEQKQLVEMKTQALKDAEPYTEKGMDAPQEIIEKYTMADDRLNALRKQESQLKNAIPDAPFKKNWQELTMKRAIQMAAEGGYDRVAFTTGKQQAERYSLSKQIDELVAYPDNTLIARKDGRNVIERKFKDESDLSDLIGKEAAKKLLETKPDMNAQKVLTGVDLDVGGEGMKGFYDKILPDFINKYGKKHGLKVGQTNLKSREIPDANLVYENAKKYGYSKEQFDRLPLEEQKKIRNEVMPKGEQVHYFDLNPEAKESFLKKGQPLFAVPPAMAITDEESRRETLERLFNNQK
jgi:hypothetical protein